MRFNGCPLMCKHFSRHVGRRHLYARIVTVCLMYLTQTQYMR